MTQHNGREGWSTNSSPMSSSILLTDGPTTHRRSPKYKEYLKSSFCKFLQRYKYPKAPPELMQAEQKGCVLRLPCSCHGSESYNKLLVSAFPCSSTEQQSPRPQVAGRRLSRLLSKLDSEHLGSPYQTKSATPKPQFKKIHDNIFCSRAERWEEA